MRTRHTFFLAIVIAGLVGLLTSRSFTTVVNTLAYVTRHAPITFVHPSRP